MTQQMTNFDVKVKALTEADIAAAKAGERGTNVLRYIKSKFCEEAYKKDAEFKKEVIMEIHPLSHKRISNLIALLTMENEYPAVLEKAVTEYKNGSCILTYKVNKEGLTENAIEKIKEAAV